MSTWGDFFGKTPFWGRKVPFWGSLAQTGVISGHLGQFWGTRGNFGVPGAVPVALTGYQEQLMSTWGHFWGRQTPFWGRKAPFWGSLAQTGTVLGHQGQFWGPGGQFLGQFWGTGGRSGVPGAINEYLGAFLG